LDVTTVWLNLRLLRHHTKHLYNNEECTDTVEILLLSLLNSRLFSLLVYCSIVMTSQSYSVFRQTTEAIVFTSHSMQSTLCSRYSVVINA